MNEELLHRQVEKNDLPAIRETQLPRRMRDAAVTLIPESVTSKLAAQFAA